MANLKQLKQKLQRDWKAKKLHQNHLDGGNLFPYRLSIKKYTANYMLNNFVAVQDEYKKIISFSKQSKIPLFCRPLALNKLGEQQIPNYFELSETDFIDWIGEKEHWLVFKKQTETLKHYPKLRPLFYNKPFIIVSHYQQFENLLKVVDWFLNTKDKHLYLRQISLDQVDTKFIEQHKNILVLMLDCCLDASQINQNETGIQNQGFEKRYGLKHQPSRIRLRILDSQIAIQNINDLEIDIKDFEQLKLDVKTVYITENKINGLCFPKKENSIVVFGLGYGVTSLINVPWLKKCEIKYWGDIDTHGFTILSALRKILPQTQSFLMEKEILLSHKKQWVSEVKQQKNNARLENLTTTEEQLYQNLIDNKYGENIRLEQELISYEALCQYLQKQ